jgi:hypothetical protein
MVHGAWCMPHGVSRTLKHTLCASSSPRLLLQAPLQCTTAGVAYNINTATGALVTVGTTGATSTTTAAPASSESTQFYFYNATSPTSPMPIASGTTAIMQSAGTDKFCRLVPLQGSVPPASASSTLRTSSSFMTKSAAAPPGFLLTLQCDVTDPAQATPLTYTSSGLMYNGQLIAPNGPGGAMVVMPSSGTTSASASTPITPAGPAIAPALPVSFNTGDGYLSVPNTATAMFTNATGTGNSPAEQFILTPATGSSTAPVLPGTTTIVQSVATGMYCRVVPGTTATSQEIKCDQPTTATATPMTYTGSGLVYNGLLLGTNGPGKPATFNSGTAVNPTSPGTNTTVTGPAVDAMLVTPGKSTCCVRMPGSCFTPFAAVWDAQCANDTQRHLQTWLWLRDCVVSDGCVEGSCPDGTIPSMTEPRCTAAAGTAYAINIPGYGNVVTGTDGSTGASTSTPSTSPAAQFYFYNATSPTSSLPLAPGASTIIKSEETGKFCRLVPTAAGTKRVPRNTPPAATVSLSSTTLMPPPGGMLVLLCDLINPAQATPLTYTSNGLAYNGRPILPVGPGGQMAVLPPGTPTPSQIPANGITTIAPVAPGNRPPPSKGTGNAAPPRPPGRACNPPRSGSAASRKPPPAPAAKKAAGSGKPPPGPRASGSGSRAPPTQATKAAAKPPPSKMVRAAKSPPDTRPTPPPSKMVRAAKSPPDTRPTPPPSSMLRAGGGSSSPPLVAQSGVSLVPLDGPGAVQASVAAAAASPPAPEGAQAVASAAASDVSQQAAAAAPFSSGLQKEEAAAAATLAEQLDTATVVTAAAAAAAAAEEGGCSVRLNAPCGGISMCGVDGSCEGHCCSAGGTCTRHSAFSWTCQQEQAAGQ